MFSDDDRDPLEVLFSELDAIPSDVVPRSEEGGPLDLRPGSVVTFIVPGQPITDVDGSLIGMIEPVSRQMTVTESGSLVGWVTDDDE